MPLPLGGSSPGLAKSSGFYMTDLPGLFNPDPVSQSLGIEPLQCTCFSNKPDFASHWQISLVATSIEN